MYKNTYGDLVYIAIMVWLSAWELYTRERSVLQFEGET